MKGVQGNEAAQARVFAHDAVSISADPNVRIPGTEDRGVCLYVGTGGTISVIMESGNPATFTNIPDGTFLPVLVTHLTSVASGAQDILALY
jgi:hypothetical protein